jgi:putative glutamine amidotransferase
VTEGGVDYDRVRCRYLAAVCDVAEGLPVIIANVVTEKEETAALLEYLDGLVLTGDQSNIAAQRYGAHQLAKAALLDTARDETVLSLIPLVLECRLPLLAICRGLQELNVSSGGDLYQDLGSEGIFIRHDEDETLPRDFQYRPSHDVLITGPLLRAIVGEETIRVSSLHKQGIRTLGSGLKIEAVAPDGLIEAVSACGPGLFALGLQWHPEWHVHSDTPSHAIFRAFGSACRERRSRRRGASPPGLPLISTALLSEA